jgi:hypothetical protein
MARHIVARTSDIPPGGNKVVGVDGLPVYVEDSYVIVET